jgi:hypothetical protein
VDEDAGDMAELQRCLAKLRAEREALSTERTQAGKQAAADQSVESADIVKLRLRVAELMAKVSSRDSPKKAADPVAPPQAPVPPEVAKKGDVRPPAEKPPPQDEADAAKPLDPGALAHALFRAGNYEQALKAYRLINLTGMKAEERSPVEYLMATCLRKLGRTDDAVALYRLVAQSRDEQVAACAQWQLVNIRWTVEMQGQLKDVRERRKALGSEP